MKIKCFSKRKFNVRISKTKIKCAILGFSPNCCILGKSREKLVKFSQIQQKFSKTSAKFWQNLQHFVKNQQKIQQFLTQKLRLENGAKFSIMDSKKLCKGVHCVDLGESFPTSIYLQILASIQPRTSPNKFVSSSSRESEFEL